MESLLFWKDDPNTKAVRNKIRDEIKLIEKELTSTILLMSGNTDELVIREYAMSIGKLEGLKFIEKIIEEDEDDRDYREKDSGTIY